MSPALNDFNSTMVRLKAVVEEYDEADYRDFNSTMVRLKVSSLYIKIPFRVLFQFHYGSVKRETCAR